MELWLCKPKQTTAFRFKIESIYCEFSTGDWDLIKDSIEPIYLT